MKQNHPSHARFPYEDWQILGELELSFGPSIGTTVSNWLAVKLNQIQASPDFSSNVIESAQAAVRRAMLFEAVLQFKHIHLIVYAPENHTLQSPTWGFFRIEKIEDAVTGEDIPNHAIELYLYLEG